MKITTISEGEIITIHKVNEIEEISNEGFFLELKDGEPILRKFILNTN